MLVPFTVTLDDVSLGALDQLAERIGSPRDWLVARAIEAYVKQNSWQLGKIHAGIAAADGGDFATNEDVERVRAKFSQTT